MYTAVTVQAVAPNEATTSRTEFSTGQRVVSFLTSRCFCTTKQKTKLCLMGHGTDSNTPEFISLLASADVTPASFS